MRYREVADALTHGVRPGVSDFSAGAQRFTVGLCKKVLLANSIGSLWEAMQASPELTAAGAWLGAAAFSFQIYFDFSGYSDMACGLGRMLGFRFPGNFRYPYTARSVTDFWRRWHITLGSWFREYVYIPLGGNRVPALRQYCNIFAVWALTGLWHGADWNFLVWGLYFGGLLVLEKRVLGGALAQRARARCSMGIPCLPLWYPWRFSPIRAGLPGIWQRMFGGAPLWSAETGYYLRSYLPTLAVLALGGHAAAQKAV